jgi:hypothetical protein
MAARPSSPNSVKAFLFLLLASLSFAQDDIADIPIAGIAKTMEHLLQKNTELKADLEATEDDLAESDSAVDALQVQVNTVTDDRNTQAALKDTALDQIVADLKLINQLREESGKLKTVVAGAITLVAALGLLLVGAPKLCMPWGIISCVALLPLIFFSVRSML